MPKRVQADTGKSVVCMQMGTAADAETELD